MAQGNSTPDATEQWLNAHFEEIRKAIKRRASELAKQEGLEVPRPKDIASAAVEFAPGSPFPTELPATPGQVFTASLAASLNGVTLLSAVLAIAFGALALFGVSGALDIAKIFAGAIVGSASGAATATVARARRTTI